MTKVKVSTLAHSLKNYFGQYLPGIRGLSPHTILSYRDTFVLLLRYIETSMHLNPINLDLEKLDRTTIIDFLSYIENERKNSAKTRNVRLAAIHSYFRYIGTHFPEYLEQSQTILGIPFKRTASSVADYISYEEMQALLNAIDCTKRRERRDYVLLSIMFNTGARVQEILDLQVCHLQLIHPFQVLLHGKGDKFRYCPLWPQTAALLQQYINEEKLEIGSSTPVFRNKFGQALTRFGVRYIINKYCKRALIIAPTLSNKHISPHSIRHGTALYLLKSGVDLVSISHWLGHSNVAVTNRYVSLDMEMRRAVIEKAKAPAAEEIATWKSNDSILTWLESI